MPTDPAYEIHPPEINVSCATSATTDSKWRLVMPRPLRSSPADAEMDKVKSDNGRSNDRLGVCSSGSPEPKDPPAAKNSRGVSR